MRSTESRARWGSACITGWMLGMSMMACSAAPDTSAGTETAEPSASTPTGTEQGAAESTGQTSEAITTCGGRAQPCCPGGVCSAPYACNFNNVCRTPCGAYGERCCGGVGGKCDFLLACYPDGTCGLL